MPKATTTIGTILKFGTALGSLTELAKIKSFPQLGGEREQIESTDLTDDFATYGSVTLDGYQSVYPLKVGGIQVTDANKGNVLGDGTVSFTPAAMSFSA